MRDFFFQIFLRVAHYFSTLHILDSLGLKGSVDEATRLQKIFEQHFEGKTFKEGWMMSNVPKVSTVLTSPL